MAGAPPDTQQVGKWENRAMAYKLLSIAPSDAFLHVIYEHRYFTLAAAATDRFGLRNSDPENQRATNELLPGIGVLIRDSLLIHARKLIEFYTRPRQHGTHPVTGETIQTDADEDFSWPPARTLTWPWTLDET